MGRTSQPSLQAQEEQASHQLQQEQGQHRHAGQRARPHPVEGIWKRAQATQWEDLEEAQASQLAHTPHTRLPTPQSGE